MFSYLDPVVLSLRGLSVPRNLESPRSQRADLALHFDPDRDCVRFAVDVELRDRRLREQDGGFCHDLRRRECRDLVNRECLEAWLRQRLFHYKSVVSQVHTGPYEVGLESGHGCDA